MSEVAVKPRVIGKPFQPGNHANPNGRPAKIHCVTSLLAELLNGDPEKVKAKWVKGKPTGAMIVALAMFAKMGRGDLTAIKEGLDRVEGKVKDLVDMTSITQINIGEIDVSNALAILVKAGAVRLGATEDGQPPSEQVHTSQADGQTVSLPATG
jgi:hypothetical protein